MRLTGQSLERLVLPLILGGQIIERPGNRGGLAAQAGGAHRKFVHADGFGRRRRRGCGGGFGLDLCEGVHCGRPVRRQNSVNAGRKAFLAPEGPANVVRAAQFIS
ncbi:MAG: hypothetical protein OSA97_11590, partial [Nevskia sp.]|nr:hypothetical protein [Nevskia sp.]